MNKIRFPEWFLFLLCKWKFWIKPSKVIIQQAGKVFDKEKVYANTLSYWNPWLLRRKHSQVVWCAGHWCCDKAPQQKVVDGGIWLTVPKGESIATGEARQLEQETSHLNPSRKQRGNWKWDGAEILKAHLGRCTSSSKGATSSPNSATNRGQVFKCQSLCGAFVSQITTCVHSQLRQSRSKFQFWHFLVIWP